MLTASRPRSSSSPAAALRTASCARALRGRPRGAGSASSAAGRSRSWCPGAAMMLTSSKLNYQFRTSPGWAASPPASTLDSPRHPRWNLLTDDQICLQMAKYAASLGFRCAACGMDKRNLLVLPGRRPPGRPDPPESEVSPMLRRRRDTPAARRQPPESGGWRQRPEPGGWRQPPQPDGWRQPPETTAEPVPLRRPYVPPDAFPPKDLTPPPSRFRPRRRPAVPRPNAQGQPPAGAASPPPARRQPAMRRWRPMRAIIGDEFQDADLLVRVRQLHRALHERGRGRRA